MAKFDVVDMNGKKVSTVELSDAVFGITPNEKAVHEAVVNFLANQRQGTQNTKIRKKSAAAARSRGVRRAPAMRARARSALRSGPTAALPSAPSRAITPTASTRRSSAWPCSAPCLTRLPTAT